MGQPVLHSIKKSIIILVVTCPVETIHANCIDTRSKACNLLIGIVCPIKVLCAVCDITATTKSGAAPAAEVGIVEGWVDNLSRHVRRIRDRGLVLSPLLIGSIKISLSLLYLGHRGLRIGKHCLGGIGTSEALVLKVLDGSLQFLLCIDE